jgi:hypothetical protein
MNRNDAVMMIENSFNLEFARRRCNVAPIEIINILSGRYPRLPGVTGP